MLGSADNVLCPLYSICILIWITAFIKAWKREEAKLAFRWNVEDFEETERERREFRGPMRRGMYELSPRHTRTRVQAHTPCGS